MGWNTIRRATDADKKALEAAARKFCERHAIRCNEFDQPEMTIDCEIDCNPDNGAYLKKLWRGCVRRALNEPQADGIAYDYVGYSFP